MHVAFKNSGWWGMNMSFKILFIATRSNYLSSTSYSLFSYLMEKINWKGRIFVFKITYTHKSILLMTKEFRNELTQKHLQFEMQFSSHNDDSDDDCLTDCYPEFDTITIDLRFKSREQTYTTLEPSSSPTHNLLLNGWQEDEDIHMLWFLLSKAPLQQRRRRSAKFYSSTCNFCKLFYRSACDNTLCCRNLLVNFIQVWEIHESITFKIRKYSQTLAAKLDLWFALFPLFESNRCLVYVDGSKCEPGLRIMCRI